MNIFGHFCTKSFMCELKFNGDDRNTGGSYKQFEEKICMLKPRVPAQNIAVMAGFFRFSQQLNTCIINQKLCCHA